MPDFNYLNDFDVTNASTSKYKMYQIELKGKHPVLTVLPATQANEKYFNALLKRSKRIQRQVESGNIDTALLQANREEDKGLYPEYVITGWRNVFDSAGKSVEFTKENCTDFLAALPDHVFDDLADFCRTPQSFIETSVREVGNGSAKK